MTPDVLQGSPRLDGRRLAVGDIVSYVDMLQDLTKYQEEFELNEAQIKECLNYCRTRQCVADSPRTFCHNCTLRVQHDHDIIDGEQDNWVRAERNFQRLFITSGRLGTLEDHEAE